MLSKGKLGFQYKILPWRFCAVFLLPRARAKSDWLEVDRELDMGRPAFDINMSVLKLQGSLLQRSSGNTQPLQGAGMGVWGGVGSKGCRVVLCVCVCAFKTFIPATESPERRRVQKGF